MDLLRTDPAASARRGLICSRCSKDCVWMRTHAGAGALEGATLSKEPNAVVVPPHCIRPLRRRGVAGLKARTSRTWCTGCKSLQRFIATVFGIALKEQAQVVEAISDTVTDVGLHVRQAMTTHPAFADIGKRTLLAWFEGVEGLRSEGCVPLAIWKAGAAIEGFSLPVKPHDPVAKNKIGRSPLFGRR